MVKRKLGRISTKKCKRCKESFYPNTLGNIYCPRCSGRPYKTKRLEAAKHKAND